MCSRISYCLSNPSLPDFISSHRIYIWENVLFDLLQINLGNIIQLLISGLFFPLYTTSFPNISWMCLHSSHCLCCLKKADTHLHFSCFVLHFNWDIVTAFFFPLAFFSLLFWVTYYLIFFFNLADVFIIIIQLEDSQWGCMETRH